MSFCSCHTPSLTPNPRRLDTCQSCLRQLNPDHLTSDRTVRAFFDRLEKASFPLPELLAESPTPALQSFRAFRAECEARERRGRERFGYSYLTKDNAQEAAEEWADGAIYSLCSLLCQRQRGEEEEWSIALTAAQHAYKAWEFSRALPAHRHVQFSDGGGI